MLLRDPLLTGWQNLSPEQLSERILQIQRLAAGGHLPAYVWRVVDKMRDRLKCLQKAES
jgi:hypothetical protein